MRALFAFLFLATLIKTSSATCRTCQSLFSPAEYPNFFELSQNHQEGIDFRIVERNQGHKVTIIAPHGGRIEPGTSLIAREVAGSIFNLYLFESLLRAGNSKLHITSHNFDEERAVKLLRSSVHGFSIHGFHDDRHASILIGGGDKVLAQRMALALGEAGFNIEFPSLRFPGERPENIVNLARNQGVQLELSSRLRMQLLKERIFRRKFIDTVRRVLLTEH